MPPVSCFEKNPWMDVEICERCAFQLVVASIPVISVRTHLHCTRRNVVQAHKLPCTYLS